MDVEKIFSPNKYFVAFCALLILVLLAYRSVGTLFVEDSATHLSRGIFSWNWPEIGWKSQAKITGVKVIKKSDTDAEVEISGKQKLTQLKNNAVQLIDCSARLILYKSSNNWILGKVELH